MFTDTPENYRKRLEELPAKVAAALSAVALSGPANEAQIALITETAAELNELLDWQAYNDSYSRTSSWLFRDYLTISPDQARFAARFLPLLPANGYHTLTEAFHAYCHLVGRRRIQDDYITTWLAENPGAADPP